MLFWASGVGRLATAFILPTILWVQNGWGLTTVFACLATLLFIAAVAVTQLGPIVTVLVVAGAGATAICADLGARTIREEVDAMEVLGIDPIHRLVVPRVIASTVVAVLLNGLVIAVGLTSPAVPTSPR